MTAGDPTAGDVMRLRPAPRWVAPVFAVLGVATVPWTAYLAMSLPQQAHTHNYRIAWVGFDLMLIVVLLATAHAAWRGRPVVGLLAAATATMLVVDAWFDVTTSRRSEVPSAILSAVLVELPLALLCVWIALHVDQVVERRLRQLARRAARLQPGTPAAATADAAVRTARAGRGAAQAAEQATSRGLQAAERSVDEAEGRR